jgi:hypothetical protein
VTAACTHLFTAGASTSNGFIQYCVTDNGNISSIQTPFGHFHLGAQGEGYGVCQESPATEYHDYISDASANWGTAQLVSLTSTAIKISRTTADGNWTLVQTITKVPATGAIKIVMVLTNNQAVAKVAYLVRFADVDPDGYRVHDVVAGASLQSAFSWSAYSQNSPYFYGLQLQNTGAWNAYQQGFVQPIPNGPNACAFAYNASISGAVLNFGDSSILYAYVGTVAAHKSMTVTMNYRGT